MTPPPTSIDGTDITGATIDGQEVQEITVDGQTVFTAAPPPPDEGDLLHHFAARLESGLSDNETTTTITDHQGGDDVTGDAVEFQTNFQNGQPTFFFDGSDILTYTNVSLTQTFTIAFVAQSTADNASQFFIAADGKDNNINMDTGEFNNRLSISAGGDLDANGADDLDFNLFVCRFDGGSSLIRKNGSSIAFGDAGSSGWNDIKLGDRGGGFNFQGFMPELLIYTGRRPAGIEDFLADIYGLTI